MEHLHIDNEIVRDSLATAAAGGGLWATLRNLFSGRRRQSEPSDLGTKIEALRVEFVALRADMNRRFDNVDERMNGFGRELESHRQDDHTEFRLLWNRVGALEAKPQQ